MQVKITALIFAVFLATSVLGNFAVMEEEKEQIPVGWWTNWARDTNNNKIDDILEKELTVYKGQSIKVFVDYYKKPTKEDIETLQNFGKITYITKYIDAIVVELPIGKINEVASLKNVVMIEYNLKMQIALDTSVPAMGIDEVWVQYDVKGEGIVIAVIDTGIDANHTSLNDIDDFMNTNDPKVIAFYDAVNSPDEENGTTTPYDDHGHGSHVAGIVSGTGEGNPNYKYIGVAPKSKLVGIKVLAGDGTGVQDDAVRGIEWAIDNKEKFGIDILSMSFGAVFSFGTGDGSSAVTRATDVAVKNGLTCIIAAGNSGPWRRTIAPPGDSREGITVGNVDDDGNLQSSSSRGPAGPYGGSYTKPDVCAPGTDIYSVEANSGNRYTSMSGTSMSAPQVSGLVALMLSVNPGLTPYQIKEILHNTSGGEESYPMQGSPNNDYGWGVVNSMEAVKNASNTTGSRPTVSINYPTNYQVVSGVVNIQGTANSEGNEISKVEIKIDEKGKDEAEWKEAEGTTNWNYSWDTSAIEEGLYVIKARAYNGVYSNEEDIEVSVDNSLPPTIKITSPKENEVISKIYNISGTTSGNVVFVRIKIDDGIFENAVPNGTDYSKWRFMLDTSKFADGKHKITAEAEGVNGKKSTAIVNIEIKNVVDANDRNNGKTFINGFTFVLFIIAISVISILTYRKFKR